MSTSMSTLIEDASPLAYRLSKPSGNAHRLLVLCHGVGGNETNLAPLAAHVPGDTAVVLARAPLPLGPDQYAWFQVAFGPQGPRPDFAAAQSSRVRLAAFVEHMQSALGIAPARTVVAGFSQGGIMGAGVSGFHSKDGSQLHGAPVGLAQDRDGALLIADDVGDAVWRVTAAR
jgi:phospholipase/carboxylesterase